MNIFTSECLEAMKSMPENSVDSIVTDPPYGLSFMGKKWDYDVPSVEIWQEAMRVLKPGGHLLSFAGSRTYHRMAVNIEDAGFEIRDQIMWVYGSGFPKSHNIGKAVDKLQGNEREVIGKQKGAGSTGNNTNTGNQTFVAKNQHEDGTHDITKGNSPYEGWGTALKPSHEDVVVARKPFIQSHLPDNSVRDILSAICQLPSLATTVKKILESNQKEQKEVVNIVQWIADESTSTQDVLFVLMATLQSEIAKGNTNLSIVSSWLTTLGDLLRHWNTFTTETKTSLIIDLKTLNSLLVQTIQNFTTKDEIILDGKNANVLIVDNIFSVVKLKLKTILELFAGENAMSKAGEQGLRPKHEPIVVARKPLSEKTIAKNVLEWGTGGINIDECRVGTETIKLPQTNGVFAHSGSGKEQKHFVDKNKGQTIETQGRWPANFIHDGSDEVVSLFPETKTGKVASHSTKGMWGSGADTSYIDPGGGGSAARFFYCAKASKKDRNEGLDKFEKKERVRQGLAGEKKNTHSANSHPTVKPTKLMQYLVRLVTPKGGTVLDPFMGSGSTGKACVLEGFDFIGIEMNLEYVEIAKARIEEAKNK